MKYKLISKTTQITEGYWNMIFATKKIKKLVAYRKKITDEKCHCSDWYVKFKLFGKQFKWFEYCNQCGCIQNAKRSCVSCECFKGNW